MLWDRGTWIPEVDDVAAALRKGDLKFRLEGVKLKGSWALVRTRSAGERSWLLLKHRDEWAGPIDIAEFAPLSVKSGGDFADILAEENPDVWQSHRPAKGGDAGAMFAKIIARALEIRDEREGKKTATVKRGPHTVAPVPAVPSSLPPRKPTVRPRAAKRATTAKSAKPAKTAKTDRSTKAGAKRPASGSKRAR
jgi:bifunctional non-homologous end joining protein LigD